MLKNYLIRFQYIFYFIIILFIIISGCVVYYNPFMPNTNTDNSEQSQITTDSGPQIISAAANDGTVLIAGIDDDDTMTITFNEDTNQPSITNLNINSVLALNNGHSWLSGSGAINSIAWQNATTLIIRFSIDGGAPTLELTDTITLDGTTIRDTSNNNSSTIPFSPILGSFTADSTPPAISSVTTADTNSNGYIDRLIVTFNENVNSSTISFANYSVSSGTISGVVDDGT
ncbi:MAG: hypothetical protein JXB50_06555, partial [Spirochaetes bacterium]|nr:hypothetical protein [Spirochaetota bacterium]